MTGIEFTTALNSNLCTTKQSSVETVWPLPKCYVKYISIYNNLNWKVHNKTKEWVLGVVLPAAPGPLM